MQAGLVCSQIRSICSKTKHICPQISPICPLPLLVGGAVCCNSCVILCAWKTKWYFQIYLGPAKPSVSFFRCAGSLAPIPMSGPDSHTSFCATLGTSYKHKAWAWACFIWICLLKKSNASSGQSSITAWTLLKQGWHTQDGQWFRLMKKCCLSDNQAVTVRVFWLPEGLG